MPESVGSYVFLIGSLASFMSFNIILPSPSRPHPILSVSDTPFRLRWGKEKKKKWLFIHLEYYRPLKCVSDWLWQITSQMCGTVYFSRFRALLKPMDHSQLFICTAPDFMSTKPLLPVKIIYYHHSVLTGCYIFTDFCCLLILEKEKKIWISGN